MDRTCKTCDFKITCAECQSTGVTFDPHAWDDVDEWTNVDWGKVHARKFINSAPPKGTRTFAETQLIWILRGRR